MLFWKVKTRSCYSAFLFVSQRVEELEKKQKSEMLDTYKNLIFVKDRGHMHVEMTETVEGLEVRPQKTQVKKSNTKTLS